MKQKAPKSLSFTAQNEKNSIAKEIIESAFKRLNQTRDQSFFFIKVFCLFLILAFSAQTVFATEGEDGLKTLDGIIEQCEKDVTFAGNETKGMDIASYAIMQQVTQQAVSVAGESARTAHQGSAAINMVLTVNATKRCLKCKEAIEVCEESCGSENKCSTFLLENRETCKCGEGGALPEKCHGGCEACREKLMTSHTKCKALSSDCENVCLQAGLSSMTALTNLESAKKLGNCRGANCSNSLKESLEASSQDPNQLKLPDGVSAVSSVPHFGHSEGSVAQNSPQFNTASLAGTKKQVEKDTKDADQKKTHYYGREGLATNIKPAPSSSSPQGSIAGVSAGGSPSGLKPFSSRGDKSHFANKGQEDYEEEDYEEELFLAQTFNSAAGGLAGSRSARGGDNRFGGSKRGFQGKKSKRDLSGKDTGKEEAGGRSGRDTIFTRASRLIYNFCDGGRC